MPVFDVLGAVREAVEEEFAGSFNEALSEACGAKGIANLNYAINFNFADGLPQNFYREDWLIDELMARREPVFPALALWTGNGAEYGPGQRSMPRAFSGYAFMHWRFFLTINGLRATGLTALREATHSAMVSCLVPEFSDVTYRKDLVWESQARRDWLDQDGQNVGFLQQIDYQASFEVNL